MGPGVRGGGHGQLSELLVKTINRPHARILRIFPLLVGRGLHGREPMYKAYRRYELETILGYRKDAATAVDIAMLELIQWDLLLRTIGS